MAQVVIPGFRKIETSEQGTGDYNSLSNIPFINDVPVKGNLKTEDLKLTDSTLTKEGIPAESKIVGQKLDEKIDKQSFNDAGIKSVEYEEMFGGEFTVTTIKTDDFISPHATVSVTGRLPKEYQYRVTIGADQYIVNCNIGIIFGTGSNNCYEFIGNISLYQEDVSGVTYINDAVPFLIISDLSSNDIIDVFTKNESTLSLKVEKIVPSVGLIPQPLLTNDNYTMIRQLINNGSAFDGVSIGINEVKNKRATFVIGAMNKTASQFAYVFGNGNTVTGDDATCIGRSNNASANFSRVLGSFGVASETGASSLGYKTTASGKYSTALGNASTASGHSSTAIGYKTTASNTAATSSGYQTTASGQGSFASGLSTEASGSMSHSCNSKTKAIGFASTSHGNRTEAAQPSQFVCGYGNDPQEDSIFEVGNGLKADGTPLNLGDDEPATKQNAFRVTQDGRAVAQTGVQIGETNITEDQLKKLLALLSN